MKRDPHAKTGNAFWIAGVIFVFIVIGAGIYYFFISRPAKETAPTAQPAVKLPAPVAPARPLDKESKELPPIPLVELNQSDGLVAKLAREISAHPQLAEWLKIKDLIRRITAAVDNIADGSSPRAHLRFLAPQKNFTVKKQSGSLTVNSQSYQRYNVVADVFNSLNTEGILRIYKGMKPLFQEAYRDLGYPNRDFQDTLIRAIKELLQTPVVEGDIFLEEEMLIYTMTDENLEDLSDAQKHLLRMGPENTRKMQNKLREMVMALGVPENQVSQIHVYRAKGK
ncbi:MAG: DUF3014 domain-containing protein [Deltaproteobacteria bacterium]|nr:DUF3014 domain-containing protein [Deltaproteobacteria bacterium]